MHKQGLRIGIDRIQLNTGQLDWLPRNPRTWTQEDIDRTAASIEEDPDFLEERPILVVPFGKEFVAFGGNLRHEGCAKLGRKTAPCVVYYPESEEDYETVKRRAMKDNGTFGKWDWDTLANEWGDEPLPDWGVPAWEAKQPQPGDYGENFSLPNGNKPSSSQITFYFAAEQKEFIENALEDAEEGEDNFGNESKNGNKLYQIVKEWAESRT